MALGDPICNPTSFYDESKYQGVCAVTNESGDFHAHHVVYVQVLRKEFGWPAKDDRYYDTRNSLRVNELAHTRHHRAIRKIKVTELLDGNIEYGFEKLGPKAYDYFERYYDNSMKDPRLELQLQLAEGNDGQ